MVFRFFHRYFAIVLVFIGLSGGQGFSGSREEALRLLKDVASAVITQAASSAVGRLTVYATSASATVYNAFTSSPILPIPPTGLAAEVEKQVKELGLDPKHNFVEVSRALYNSGDDVMSTLSSSQNPRKQFVEELFTLGGKAYTSSLEKLNKHSKEKDVKLENPFLFAGETSKIWSLLEGFQVSQLSAYQRLTETNKPTPSTDITNTLKGIENDMKQRACMTFFVMSYYYACVEKHIQVLKENLKLTHQIGELEGSLKLIEDTGARRDCQSAITKAECTVAESDSKKAAIKAKVEQKLRVPGVEKKLITQTLRTQYDRSSEVANYFNPLLTVETLNAVFASMRHGLVPAIEIDEKRTGEQEHWNYSGIWKIITGKDTDMTLVNFQGFAKTKFAAIPKAPPVVVPSTKDLGGDEDGIVDVEPGTEGSAPS